MRERLGIWLPGVVAMLLVLMFQGATPLIAPTSPLPHLAAIMAFFWALYRPAAFPSLLLLALGLMLDVLDGQPLGLEACLLLGLRAIVEGRLRDWAERPFLLQWLLFGALFAALLVLKSGLLQWYLHQPISWTRASMAWLLSFLCYPLLHMLCSWIYLALPHPPGSHPSGMKPRPPTTRPPTNRH